ncbi:saccharopine dehydrogenase [Actinomadura flavalba]|uniref:saccharopine dehydrogenase n=1 Tax=Actinomadura flavalba TaxID=1120938 RepID=UPI0003736AA4|nr:saccharopine dehydrogenase [Actinomadura flavalba]
MAEPHLWLRHETYPHEHRTPLVPGDAARLVAAGTRVTVEESAARVFPDADYAAAGCRLVPPGTWPDAPADACVLGLKELPASDEPLRHRHVYFAHAYKGQRDAAALLARFAAGGGVLLDLEYLVDERGRRLAAFGRWAGYVGAALAVLHLAGRLPDPLRPTTRDDLDAALAAADLGARAVVTGALGRCGGGAVAALERAGVDVSRWDLAETERLDRRALLAHDLLVHAVGVTRPIRPFLTASDLDDPARRLTTVADVTCDVGSDCHLLPFYDRTTSWDDPVLRVRDGDPALDVIAIDNLPSLLPAEASTTFSADLTPLLEGLPRGGPVWERCEDAFVDTLRREARVG